MKPRLEMIGESDPRRSLAFACASFAFYGSAMLAVALFAQPLETHTAIKTVQAPAAGASVSANQAERPIEQYTPARGARTVSRPESIPPVSGEVAIPTQQL